MGIITPARSMHEAAMHDGEFRRVPPKNRKTGELNATPHTAAAAGALACA